MKTEKYIFLDFDGVLNHENFYNKRHEIGIDKYPPYPLCEIDPKSVENLNYIVKETDAKVVVSSSWRHGRSKKELQSILDNSGFIGEVIDVTPNLINFEGSVRGNEIWAWIKNNVENYFDFFDYVIFDDDCDMLYYQKDNFIHVDKWVGITGRDVMRAKSILKGNRGLLIL